MDPVAGFPKEDVPAAAPPKEGWPNRDMLDVTGVEIDRVKIVSENIKMLIFFSLSHLHPLLLLPVPHADVLVPHDVPP